MGLNREGVLAENGTENGTPKRMEHPNGSGVKQNPAVLSDIFEANVLSNTY